MKFKILLFLFISTLMIAGLAPKLTSAQNLISQEEIKDYEKPYSIKTPALIKKSAPKRGVQTLSLLQITIQNVALGLAIILFIIVIIVAGLHWIFSGGNEEATSKAKKLMTTAVIGILITLGAGGIANFILVQLGVRDGIFAVQRYIEQTGTKVPQGPSEDSSKPSGSTITGETARPIPVVNGDNPCVTNPEKCKTATINFVDRNNTFQSLPDVNYEVYTYVEQSVWDEESNGYKTEKYYRRISNGVSGQPINLPVSSEFSINDVRNTPLYIRVTDSRNPIVDTYTNVTVKRDGQSNFVLLVNPPDNK